MFGGLLDDPDARNFALAGLLGQIGSAFAPTTDPGARQKALAQMPMAAMQGGMMGRQMAGFRQESAMREAMQPEDPNKPVSPMAQQYRSLIGQLPERARAAFALLPPDQRGQMITRLLTQNSTAPLSQQEVQQLGLRPGTVAQRDENGRIHVVQAQPEILDPAVQDARLRIAQAGRSTTVVRLPPMENAFAQATGTSLAGEANDIRAAGTRSAETLRDIRRFADALNAFPTGAAANARLSVGQWAQQLGLPERLLPQGISRDAVMSGEEMRSITSRMLTNMIGPGGFPAQNFSNADREAIERALPGVGNTPSGNRVILQAAEAAARRNIEVSNAWRDWSMRNGNSAESYQRFLAEKMPELTQRDVIAPVFIPQAPAQTVPGPGNSGTAAPPPQAGQRVRVNTIEEARRLPPGTLIQLPDGTPGVVPERRR